jgi:CBS domain-containing protein
MKVIDAIRRSGVGVSPERTIHEASVLMEQAGVGSLVIIDGDRLVGIVTDRDLVRRGLARGLSPDARIDAVMSTPVVTIDADADLHSTYEVFRTHPLRRLAVTRDDQFVGTVSVDDLLVDVVGHLADLIRPVTAEVLFAQHDAGPLATT